MMIEMVDMTEKSRNCKATILNANLCDHSGAYILDERWITAVGQGADAAAIAADRNDKEVVFKNCAPFLKCITKINNAKVKYKEELDIVMQMYNLLGYSENMQTQLFHGNIIKMNHMIT